MRTKRKVYTFYIVAILVMVLVLMLFDLKHGHLPHKPLYESIFLPVKTEKRCQQEEGEG